MVLLTPEKQSTKPPQELRRSGRPAILGLVLHAPGELPDPTGPADDVAPGAEEITTAGGRVRNGSCYAQGRVEEVEEAHGERY